MTVMLETIFLLQRPASVLSAMSGLSPKLPDRLLRVDFRLSNPLLETPSRVRK